MITSLSPTHVSSDFQILQCMSTAGARQLRTAAANGSRKKRHRAFRSRWKKCSCQIPYGWNLATARTSREQARLFHPQAPPQTPSDPQRRTRTSLRARSKQQPLHTLERPDLHRRSPSTRAAISPAFRHPARANADARREARRHANAMSKHPALMQAPTRAARKPRRSEA